MNACRIDGCEATALQRELCHRCYERLRYHGQIERIYPMPVEDRFWPKVNVGAEDECWEWTAYVNPRTGYGQFSIPKALRPTWGGHRTVTAPVVACSLTHGHRPDGMWVLHACDNPICCNPSHLSWGTPRENIRQAVERGRHRGPHSMRKVAA